jgi:hypothetical protein
MSENVKLLERSLKLLIKSYESRLEQLKIMKKFDARIDKEFSDTKSDLEEYKKMLEELKTVK